MSDSQNKQQLTFRNYDIPGLPDGSYYLSIEQYLSTTPQAFTHDQAFHVYGPQFSLPPGTIQSVFPPSNNQGDYTNVLPHVVLDSSTLPWERNCQENAESSPWLALLLFDEEQTPQVQTINSDEFVIGSDVSPFWPPVSQDSTSQQLNVIDIPQSLVASIMPHYSELINLTHIREERDQDDNLISSPTSIVVTNRLPEKNKLTTVHLVSIENRFVNGVFDFQQAQQQDLIRFATLHSWQFYCEDSNKQLLQLLENLDSGQFRLAPQHNSDAEKYLQQSATLLPHNTRTGDRLYSWYRGPLFAGYPPQNNFAPVRCADELMIFDTQTAMFDVSYATAWQLGRLLALKDKSFSTAFYEWKRNHAYAIHQLEQQEIYGHLPFAQDENQSPQEVPQQVAQFFTDIRYLKRIPFNYLVPDENLLPQESIRFFSVDTTWSDYVVDGAFSVGRVTSLDLQRDTQLHKQARETTVTQQLSGFLLRSQVIAGWPDLEIYVFGEDQTPLPQVQKTTVSKNILFVVVEGQLNSVSIQQKAQSIHFGFDISQNSFYKKLRNPSDGSYYSADYNVDITWRDDTQRIVDIDALNTAIAQKLQQQSLSSSLFAMEMVEGVPQLLFTVKN